jgi:hypothetical protein
MTAELDVQTRDGVLLLTIDNPAQRNALTPDFSRRRGNHDSFASFVVKSDFGKVRCP